ncbi:helix-turn-helix domain-containing protein [Candidatus Alkanophaga liquidiphilum]|nr:putative transcriptional regulator [Candidatus Alkanophaga liquidiphilum]
MLKVQIRTSLPESCVFGAVKEILRNSVMKIEGLMMIDKNVKALLRVKANKVKDILADLPAYCEGVAVSSQEAKVLVREHTCFVALSILEAGCIITDAEIDERKVIWSIVCEDEAFLNLIRGLEESEIDFEIVYKGEPEKESEVTYREEEILRLALERGYFDFPKRIKLEELADYFGIASSTLSEILRRGQKKVLEKYFGLKG